MNMLEKVLKEAGLTPQETDTAKAHINGQADTTDFYDTPAYEKLYEYFVFDIAIMPYGTAKARTGDPDVWILDHLHDIHTLDTQGSIV